MIARMTTVIIQEERRDMVAILIFGVVMATTSDLGKVTSVQFSRLQIKLTIMVRRMA